MVTLSEQDEKWLDSLNLEDKVVDMLLDYYNSVDELKEAMETYEDRSPYYIIDGKDFTIVTEAEADDMVYEYIDECIDDMERTTNYQYSWLVRAIDRRNVELSIEDIYDATEVYNASTGKCTYYWES